ncbi:flagellar protein FlaG [Shewanella sp. AS1]|uniref:flagellar protein FlaG n=1 Tax=Shewanella sp. AS1 TaxID=2907626 RepID=UPI001F2B0EA6|nr:flagellar protein FlaG [Shewanella sp. AS1]MCE9680009.1 flagellar protein FlaG [Shewanella sp. AS1]
MSSRDGVSTLTEKNIANIPQENNGQIGNKIESESSLTEAQKRQQTATFDVKALQEAMDNIADNMNLIQKGLAFNVDEDSGEQVVKVIDVTTGELIRQIPNEEALEIAKKLNEVTGLLLKTEV